MSNKTKNETKRIYIASPYSAVYPQRHNIRAVEDYRYEMVTRVTGLLMCQFPEYIFYSPITHSHPIARATNIPGNFKYWSKFAESFLEWCDELWIYMLNGWKRSKGVTSEIITTLTLNKPIRRVTKDGYVLFSPQEPTFPIKVQ